jgi:hypothetical protein
MTVERGGGAVRALLSLLLVVGGLLLGAFPALASYDPVGAGSTRIALDNELLELLKENGVTLHAVAPATLRGSVVTFPAVGGRFDPLSARGAIQHEGALLLRSPAGEIPIKGLQLKTTQRHAPLSAKVGGSQLKLATVRSLAVARQGFGSVIRTGALSMSSKLATRLGKKLRLRGVLKAGLALGRSETKIQPSTVTLLGKGAATLILDPGFAAKLQSLFVAVNPIFPAEHLGSVFSLPIFGGDLAPNASTGRVETSGALEFLQLGGGQVFWRSPRVSFDTEALEAELDAEPSPPYPGKSGVVPVGPLALGAAAVADAKRRTVSIAGAVVSLSPSSAALFDEVFARPQGKDDVFVPGEQIAEASFQAQAQ